MRRFLGIAPARLHPPGWLWVSAFSSCLRCPVADRAVSVSEDGRLALAAFAAGPDRGRG
jgi:hypothetical protein